MTRHNGIDVSTVQGRIDWSQVAASGIEFAYVKASEGGKYVDPAFGANASGALASGLKVGAYHFLYSQTDPEAQASLFVGTIKNQSLNLPPVVDMETPSPSAWAVHGGADLIANCLKFCQKVTALTGLVPMIYSYPWYLNSLIGADALAGYGLWLAVYHTETVAPTETTNPTVPAPWKTWQCWQWSGNNGLHVPGIGPVVDHDVWNGDFPTSTQVSACQD